MNDLKKELDLIYKSIIRFNINTSWILRREFRKYWWKNRLYKTAILNYSRRLFGLSYLDNGWHSGKIKDPFIIKFPIQ